jgi:DNA invertase Pin-like site-specific DNA recombinase
MANVTIIPARRQVGNNVKQAEQPKLRIAAYCRVSTDSDEQETSYETQVSHYTEYIKSHSEWELAGIFADDGISGTNTKKRDEFNRMIDECMAGNIDMIITKSISRFARNTLDCLKYIRLLKDKNIAVWFEKESINTMDSKGEVLITIMASLAQQESQSLSQNVKLGLQYRYQQGKVQVNHNHFLGYTKDSDGHLVIDPEQAEVVKRIYREYLEGLSMKKIAEGLEQDGILTGAGKTKWYDSTINKILRNLSLSILIQCNDSGYVKKSEKYSAFSVFDRWRRSVDVLLNSRSFYARRAKKAKCTHNHTIAFYRVIVGLSCNDMQLKKPDTVS